MKNLIKNQAGFGVVGIILIVLAIGLIGATGWYVWQKNQDSNKSQSTQNDDDSRPVEQIDTDQEEITEEWIVYSSRAGKFSLKYPPSWVFPSNIEQCPEDSTVFRVGPNEDSAGKCQSGDSGQVVFSSSDGDRRTEAGQGTVVTEVVHEGVSGTRKSLVESDPQGFHPDGTKFVVYEFYTNGRTYRATYRQWPTESDQLSVFEEILQTFRFSDEGRL